MDAPSRHSLRPALLALVLVGGTVGTAVRAGLESAVPPAPGGWPWATFVVNIVGSFGLGWLLAALATSGWGGDRRRRVWLAVGTGGLGGLTTYSTFALQVVLLLRDGEPATGIGYATGSVLAGLVAALAGYVAGGGTGGEGR